MTERINIAQFMVDTIKDILIVAPYMSIERRRTIATQMSNRIKRLFWDNTSPDVQMCVHRIKFMITLLTSIHKSPTPQLHPQPQYIHTRTPMHQCPRPQYVCGCAPTPVCMNRMHCHMWYPCANMHRNMCMCCGRY